MKPTIRQLEHLIALEETGSFSRAAENCHITQSSLSASIKELETTMGQPIVNRQRKNMTLTPFGDEVLKTAHEITEKINSLMNKARQYDTPMTGTLRLGIIPTIAPYILPDLVPSITKKYINLQLQLRENQTETLLDQLRKNQIDLALMAFPYQTEGLEQEILASEPFFAAIPKGRKQAPPHIYIRDLKPDEILLLEDGHCLRQHALDACRLQLPRQKQTFRASSLPTLIEMVRNGLGMTLLPEMACKKGVVPNGIEILPFKDTPQPTRQIGVCWRKNNPQTRNIHILSEDIRMHLNCAAA